MYVMKLKSVKAAFHIANSDRVILCYDKVSLTVCMHAFDSSSVGVGSVLCPRIALGTQRLRVCTVRHSVLVI